MMGDKKEKIDMERLLTTQQLSDYKTWPDGKSGIVFYIEELNGLYRIDCPWRKGAKWEEYNKLLPCEMEMCYDHRTIIDTKVLVSGFGAFMITYYVCHLTGANRSHVDFGKLVEVYFDYLLAHNDEQISIHSEYMAYASNCFRGDNEQKWFTWLCGEDADYKGFMAAWSKLLLKRRDKYVDELTIYKMLFEESLPMSITMDNREDDTYEVEIEYDDEVSENMPKTKKYKKENYGGEYDYNCFPMIKKVYDGVLACYAHKDGEIYKEDWDESAEDDWYAVGFVAAYANYCMMNTFCEVVRNMHNAKEIAMELSFITEFELNKADYDHYSINKKELFDCYLRTRIEQTREYLEHEDLDYVALKEEERGDYVLGYILKQEIGFATENDDLYDDLDGDKVKQIKTTLDGFLRYVYARIGDIDKYEEVKESYEGMMGEGDAARLATRYIEGGRLGDEGEGGCADNIGGNGRSKEWLWPLYGANASEEDRQTFEDFLEGLCSSKKKSLTHDIHVYLDVKEKAGLIRRPDHPNIEFEWVKKFGYPYKLGAYYKG